MRSLENIGEAAKQVSAIQFDDDDRIRHMTKVWHAGLALQALAGSRRPRRPCTSRWLSVSVPPSALVGYDQGAVPDRQQFGNREPAQPAKETT